VNAGQRPTPTPLQRLQRSTMLTYPQPDEIIGGIGGCARIRTLDPLIKRKPARGFFPEISMRLVPKARCLSRRNARQEREFGNAGGRRCATRPTERTLGAFSRQGIGLCATVPTFREAVRIERCHSCPPSGMCRRCRHLCPGSRCTPRQSLKRWCSGEECR
jgi:hypothetical protein